MEKSLRAALSHFKTLSMRLAISIARTALVAALALTFGACNDKRSDDVLAQDTSLTKDLALANRDTASQPQLKDVPVEATPAPVTAAPVPAPRGAHARRATAGDTADSSHSGAAGTDSAVRACCWHERHDRER